MPINVHVNELRFCLERLSCGHCTALKNYKYGVVAQGHGNEISSFDAKGKPNETVGMKIPELASVSDR